MASDNTDVAVLQVKVLPRSSKNQIIGKEGGVFKVKLTAPPVEGKANRALKELLSKRLRVAKKDIEIISGERSRMKSVRVYGLLPRVVDTLLEKGD